MSYISHYNEYDTWDEIIRVGTGIISGGVLSINLDNTKFNISSGTGMHVDLETNEQTQVEWNQYVACVPVYLNTHLISWIAIDKNANIIQKNSVFTPEENRDYIILGVLVHVNKTNIDAVNNQHRPGDHAINQLHDLMDAMGFLNISGNEFSSYSTNLQMKKTGGSIFKTGSNYYNDVHNPHILTLSALNPLVMQYRLSNGNNYTGLSQTTVIPTLYESSSGVPSSVTAATPFTIQRIFIFTSNNIKLQFGQATYKTMADAAASINTEVFTTEPSILANGLLRGYLIINKDCTNLSDTTHAKFYHAGKFGSSSSSVGGVTTLQHAYENSEASTQIITNLNNGSLKIQKGGTDNDLIVFKNASGTTRSRIDSDGAYFTGKLYSEAGMIFSADYVNTNISTPNAAHIQLRSDGYRVEVFNNGVNNALSLVSPDNIKMYSNGVQRFHLQDTGDYFSFAGKNGNARFQIQATANVSYQNFNMNNNNIINIGKFDMEFGTVASPTLSFSGSLNTGIYGAYGQVNISGLGSQLMGFTTTGNTSYKNLDMNQNDITNTKSIAIEYLSTGGASISITTYAAYATILGRDQGQMARAYWSNRGTADVDILQNSNVKFRIKNSINVMYQNLDMNGNSVVNTSDSRLKNNIKPIELGLNFINKLSPVSFKYNDTIMESEEGNYTVQHSRDHLGFIAQDVKSAINECGHNLYNTDIIDNDHLLDDAKEDHYKMRYMALIAPMVKAIQELTQRVIELENIINSN